MLEEMRKMIAEQLNCEESEITADSSFKVSWIYTG